MKYELWSGNPRLDENAEKLKTFTRLVDAEQARSIGIRLGKYNLYIKDIREGDDEHEKT